MAPDAGASTFVNKQPMSVVLPQSTLGGVTLELHARVTHVIGDICVLSTRIVKVKLWNKIYSDHYQRR